VKAKLDKIWKISDDENSFTFKLLQIVEENTKLMARLVLHQLKQLSFTHRQEQIFAVDFSGVS
jgi:hypothetical protein